MQPPVAGLCEMLGMNPWYLANEGMIALIADRDAAPELVRHLHLHQLGRTAAVIGEPCVYLQTPSRGRRILDALVSDQLPRIC